MAYSVQNITLHDVSHDYNLEFLGSMSQGAPTEWYSKGAYDANNPTTSVDWLKIIASGARMNTNYFPTNHTGFKLVATPTVKSSLATPVCGGLYNASTEPVSHRLAIRTTSNKLAIHCGNVASGYLADATATLNQEFTFEFKQESEQSTDMLLKFNGTTVRTYTQTQIGTFTSETPICIGTIYTDPRGPTLNDYYETKFWNGLKIKEFDLYEGTELVRKYVPVVSGGWCMFRDMVTNTLIPQQIFGNFWEPPQQ